MTTADLASEFAALCRERRFLDAVDRFYADSVMSVEAMDYLGQGREMRGKAAVRGKNAGWLADNEVHRAEVTGPFVSPERFALVIDFDWTRRASGERVRMQEVAVYTVENGQVTREEFLYGTMK
ncbi:MAG: nuclear transport factor 2 family protein [Bryobacteraceae bacterium]|nr:nuclear transport factor 2 family protein [Bryobacteraceae bacterium]